MLEEKARKLAEKVHEGQYRKDGVTPYISHPEGVVKILKGIGVTDEDIICAAWLHDTIEDGNISKQDIENEFNSNIARIVMLLTRDCGREQYKGRIKESEYSVKIVKLADVAHNCSTLTEDLPEKTIINKVKDCKEFYLDLAQKVNPELGSIIKECIEPWMSKYQ